ncbi:sulfide/dihydroorotate dehydrogenase-like FAD/NAD-binding protein [Halobacteroides halobius]|nr:sulfide/dihydroorotate dehydrogenase-like FAD/NAD-binding protein [Halobacteroides halobius]
MYKIIKNKVLAPMITKLEVKAPEVAAKAKPGHFLIVRVDEQAERIPLTIADYNRDKGTITIIIQEVGFSSRQICNLDKGDAFLDLVGPLGEPIETKDYDKVVCIGGGLGNAPLYPKAKSLKEHGAEVVSILGAQTAAKLILEEEFNEVSDKLYIATDDGSKGKEGFVTDILEELLEAGEEFELAIAIGPMIMMKAVSELTAKYDLETMVSLNSLMIDGTGMCGGCRVTVAGETKFACVDGPAFDGHLVDFDEQLRRQQFYKEHEAKVKQQSEHAGGEHQCHKKK